MVIRVLDDDNDCRCLLKAIQDNYFEAAKMRGQIDKLSAVLKKQEEIKDDNSHETVKSISCAEDCLDEGILEEELLFYLSDYKNLKDSFTMNDMLEILPPKTHGNFQNIFNRFLAESKREILEIQKIIFEDKDLSEDDLSELRSLICFEQRKIDCLKSIINNNNNTSILNQKKNRLFLVPTFFGNIRILEELRRIPREYYEEFYGLLNSIIHGTFQGIKIFTDNDRFRGIGEVCYHQSRIIFKRLNHDTYAIISAFVKKVDSKDQYYRSSLYNKINDYRSMESLLKSQLNNSQFLKLNEENLQELWNILGISELEDKRGILM